MSHILPRRNFLAASAAAAAGAALPGASSAVPDAPQSHFPKLAPASVEQIPQGMVIRNGREIIRITACAPDVIHIVAGPGDPQGSSPHTPWITGSWPAPAVKIEQAHEIVRLRTAKLTVEVDLRLTLIRVMDAAVKVLLQESPRVPRRYEPYLANGEKLLRVETRFFPDALEGFYGLGQHQSGVFDQRGTVVELAQINTNIAIPLLVSTLGYGLLWNTAAKSYFDNRFPTEMTFSAAAVDAIDYYVFYGPSHDRIIQLYRTLTGTAPLFGRWAYGFVQSKDRYTSARQLLNVARRYRRRQVPLDLVVQDWFWWNLQGDPEYSAAYLKPMPDVPAALRELHAENVHAMISIWAKFDLRSRNYQAMKRRGFIVEGADIYDASHTAARDYYWKHLVGVKFAEGWDGFWLDSSEPEIWNGQSDAVLDNLKLHIGNGARYTNIFPLLHTGGVYEHWRATTDRKRVFILTRSGFLGQQRHAAVVWSGDVIGTWMTLRRQIAAGLNFQMSGLPYWTTDIAGYGWPYVRDTHDPAYQELYVRWFQFGVFCPILRTHGHRADNVNSLFRYGAQTPTLIFYDKLRYRLLPYIYSLAWRVTDEHYTMQRALPMDWPNDRRARDIGDEFMFGPALLVGPVTEPGADSRSMYFPAAAGWYDFWTGEKYAGAETLAVVPAPLDRIPVFARAGSIVPMGPIVQDADGQVVELEIRVYPGADGDFTYYSDAGDTYDYEKGQRCCVAMHWDDASRTLSLGAAEGSYPEMPARVTVRLVVVRAGHGDGLDATTHPDAQTVYEGNKLTLKT